MGLAGNWSRGCHGSGLKTPAAIDREVGKYGIVGQTANCPQIYSLAARVLGVVAGLPGCAGAEQLGRIWRQGRATAPATQAGTESASDSRQKLWATPGNGAMGMDGRWKKKRIKKKKTQTGPGWSELEWERDRQASLHHTRLLARHPAPS